MQKDTRAPFSACVAAIDTHIGRAYPYWHALLIRRRRYVLLLPDAGVRVGTNEILPSHPANAGGFHFHPLVKSAGVGPDRIQLILTKSIY